VSTDTLWDVARIADALGIEPATVRSYASRGQMPPPSGHIGRSPYWAAAVIVPWMNTRGNDPAQRDVVPGASNNPTERTAP